MALGNKNRKKNIEEEEDTLMQGIASALLTTANRDSVISAKLTNIMPNPLNGRIGQGELVENLKDLVNAISSSGSKDEVPNYEDLVKLVPDTPKLSLSAQRLYDNCASLANSIISTGGYSESPPKVMPVNTDGYHVVKTGHRRYFAYCFAEPITKIGVIDILLDKSSSGYDQLSQTIERLTENTSREDNSLAEYINEVAAIIKISQNRSEPINKSKLAKQIGMERTKLGRIIEIAECGAANDTQVISRLHELQIADVTAANILFKQPKNEWLELVDELNNIGPVQFRSKYRPGGDSNHIPRSESVKPVGNNVDLKSDKNKPDTNTPEALSKGSIDPSADDPGVRLTQEKEKATPTTTKKKSAVLDQVLVSAPEKMDSREIGASKLLEMVAKVNAEILEGVEGNSFEKVLEIIERLGRV